MTQYHELQKKDLLMDYRLTWKMIPQINSSKTVPCHRQWSGFLMNWLIMQVKSKYTCRDRLFSCLFFSKVSIFTLLDRTLLFLIRFLQIWYQNKQIKCVLPLDYVELTYGDQMFWKFLTILVHSKWKGTCFIQICVAFLLTAICRGVIEMYKNLIYCHE